MALITCPECKKEISDTAKAFPSCGFELNATKKQLCSKCNLELVAVQKKNQVSAGGILGVIVFLCALPFLFFNILIGAVLIILALLVGSVNRGTHVEMICPRCQKSVKV